MLKQMTLALTLVAAPLQAGEMMSAQELMQTIPGAILSGISNEDHTTRWVQTYGLGERSGTGEGTFGERIYTSAWTIRQDLWCESWSNRSECWRIERVNATTLQPYVGQQKLPNVWIIEEPAGG
ncbi:hypothetical protein [Tropicibacter sp. Alg240-R139]|uniref:hypothetical protein n=1 Tax=Tropicibacter sp. Alg240-R139 TaxID=2305991 RepID=UPI0013E08AB2|nr:hypothetical protein [Tropicibacter sp. Alg240-R139]